jgi:hypothetical protein
VHHDMTCVDDQSSTLGESRPKSSLPPVVTEFVPTKERNFPILSGNRKCETWSTDIESSLSMCTPPFSDFLSSSPNTHEIGYFAPLLLTKPFKEKLHELQSSCETPPLSPIDFDRDEIEELEAEWIDPGVTQDLNC